jgi:hypothetical protein
MATRAQTKRSRETPVDIEAIENVAEEVTGIAFARKTESERNKTFKEHFGCRPAVARRAWLLIKQYTIHNAPDSLEIKHLLWALIFLKTYSVEGVRCTLATGKGNRPDPKTVRDWCWIALECLAKLEPYVVSVVLIDHG